MPADELLIIGAGPAGLGVSFRYAGASRILESSAVIGGLCRSITFGGGVFDIGGHCFHTPHADVADLVAGLMRGRWHSQARDARVYFRGDMIPYPFQKQFERLSDATVVTECRAGLANAAATTTAATNFEEWILRRFGVGIAEHFMLPYNRKLWGKNLQRIGCDWVGERVAESGGHKLGTRLPLNDGSEVSYPAQGGFDEIFKALAQHCGSIEFGQTVTRIDTSSRTVHTAEGGSWAWKRLVSTMPLPLLLHSIPDTPGELLADVDHLEYISLKLLLILVAGSLPNAPQRVYIADPDIPPHKVAFNHTSSLSLRNRPVHAVICEIAHSPGSPPPPDRQLQDATLDWLVDSRLVESKSCFIEARMVDVAHAYPVPTHDRQRIVAAARTYLAGHDIHTIGRFGAWDYANSDDCLRQGLELGSCLST